MRENLGRKMRMQLHLSHNRNTYNIRCSRLHPQHFSLHLPRRHSGRMPSRSSKAKRREIRCSVLKRTAMKPPISFSLHPLAQEISTSQHRLPDTMHHTSSLRRHLQIDLATALITHKTTHLHLLDHLPMPTDQPPTCPQTRGQLLTSPQNLSRHHNPHSLLPQATPLRQPQHQPQPTPNQHTRGKSPPISKSKSPQRPHPQPLTSASPPHQQSSRRT